jgi:hypothetical protein
VLSSIEIARVEELFCCKITSIDAVFLKHSTAFRPFRSFTVYYSNILFLFNTI